MSTTPSLDTRFDALIVGGGHNGLVCAAYLAQSGMKVLVIEARSEVGGTAASESFAGGHGQHLQLRPSHLPHRGHQ